MPANANPTTTATQGSIASYLGSQGLTGTNSAQNPNLLNTSGTGGILGEMYGEVPGVSNPVGAASQAIHGNIGNLTGNANLAQGADTISAAGAALPFEMNLPGYNEMLSTATGNTQQELEGQVPQDVQNLLQQQGAERGVATGQSTNSPNAAASYLQALGLTSLGQEQQGQQNLSQLIGETPTGQEYNPSSMFVTPEQQQAADQAVQQNMAAPNPTASGIFSSVMSLI